jgi:hypothetical protein
MDDMTMITKLVGASAIGVAMLGATSHVRADNFRFVNDTDSIVAFAFAEPDRSCPSGMRDHAWVGLNPRQTADVQVDTSGRFILGALRFIPVGQGILQNMTPRTNRAEFNFWDPPTDGSSAGQCSDIHDNDPNSNPNAGIWHSDWNLSGGCPAGILGAFARPFFNDQQDQSALEFDVACFVNGPAEPPLPDDPGPGPE